MYIAYWPLLENADQRVHNLMHSVKAVIAALGKTASYAVLGYWRPD